MQVKCLFHDRDGYEVSENLFRTLSLIKIPQHNHTHDAVVDALLCIVYQPDIAIQNGWVGKLCRPEDIHHAAILVLEQVHNITQNQIPELAAAAQNRVLVKQAA